jgi:hypothetical protein
MTPEHESERQTKEGRGPERAADRFIRETDDMEERSEKLHEGIDEVRQDWERKRADQSVPGANPPESEEEPPEGASFPAKEGDEGSPASPANP